MNGENKNKKILKYYFIIISIGLGLFLAGALFFYFRILYYANDAARKNDVSALESEMYDCLYVTMYSEQETNQYPFDISSKTSSREICTFLLLCIPANHFPKGNALHRFFSKGES